MDDTLILLQALGEQVESQGKHIAKLAYSITRLDELTKVQARLISIQAEELDDLRERQDAHWLAVFGANRYLIKSIDDIAFYLPPDARETLRNAHPKMSKGKGGMNL